VKQDCPLTPGSSVWAYLRVSGDAQAKCITPIASQRKALEAYCRENDLSLKRIEIHKQGVTIYYVPP